MTALSRMMFEDLFNGEGYCFITDKDGKAIAYYRVYTHQGIEGFFANIFENILTIIRSRQLPSRR